MLSEQAKNPPKRRAIVYIDGFNLYNGLVASDKLNAKWLDPHKLFANNMLANEDVVAVRYFSSPVKGPTVQNQFRYIEALKTLPNFTIELGFFQSKGHICKVQACATARCDRYFEQPSEKKTDVAIAAAMIEDALLDRADLLVLCSGDSDFIPAIETVKRNCPEKQVWVYVPTLGEDYEKLKAKIAGRKAKQSPYASELRKVAHRNGNVPVNAVLHSQFPKDLVDAEGNPLLDSRGHQISIPSDWQIADRRAYTNLIKSLEAAAAKK
jgi:uncharacterized LabA/DUF88 family protein